MLHSTMLSLPKGDKEQADQKQRDDDIFAANAGAGNGIPCAMEHTDCDDGPGAIANERGVDREDYSYPGELQEIPRACRHVRIVAERQHRPVPHRPQQSHRDAKAPEAEIAPQIIKVSAPTRLLGQ